MLVECRAEAQRAGPSRHLLATAALALAVGLTALGGARAVGAPGPRGQLLLVESNRSGTSEPYLVSLDGRATKRLPLGAGAELVDVSPLHHWITYYRHNGYWLSRLDGRAARRLPDDTEANWAPNDRALALHDVAGDALQVIAPSGRLLARFPLLVGGTGDWSPDSRWLALFPDSGPGEIDSINLDGSSRRSLFGTATTSVEAASWSPDGTRVAYELGVDDEDSSAGPYADIYVARADGSGPVAITHDHGAQINGDPAWSPDGRWLAYERIIVGGDADIAQIWVARADGSERRQLTKGSLDLNPTWTPDGSKVVFDRGGTEASTLLYQVGPDGKGLRRLGSARGVELASFAPSGSEFVADLVKGEQAALALFAPSGKLLRQLTPLGQDWEPAFSPDGRSIAFSRNGSIAVLDEVGGAPRKLTNSAHEDDERPAWSASGNRLSFEVLDSESGGTLDVIAPRSGKVLTVARDADGDEAAWSRHNEAVAYTAQDGNALYIRETFTRRLLGTVSRVAVSNISWAPDGRTVFFQADSYEHSGTLYGVDRRGRIVFRRSLRDGSDVSWSDSGRWGAIVEGNGANRGNRLAIVDAVARRVQVIVRRAGIDKDSPVFDRFGRRIAFTVERSALANDGDVFVVRRGGGRLRQVTYAFPDGGDNAPLLWLRGRLPPAERVPAVRVVQPETVARGGQVLALSADGERLAYALGAPNTYCATLHVRQIGAAADAFTGNPCGGGATLTGVQTSWDRVAWVLEHPDGGAGDDESYCLYAARLNEPLSGVNRRYACDLRYDTCTPPMRALGWGPLQLAGAGNLLAAGDVGFDYCRARKKPAWPAVVRVDLPRVTPLVRTGSKLRLLDADSSHLLLQEGPHILVVYDSRGSMLSVLHLRGTVTSALLDGPRVAILSGRVLGERDLLSGRPLEHLLLAASLGQLTLRDANGGLAAYTEGTVVHVVRFADRRDAALWIPKLARVQQVALTPAGLVAGAQVSTFARGGLVALVPWQQVSESLAGIG